MNIEGTGRDGGGKNEAKVNPAGELIVEAIIQSEFEHVSDRHGQSFNWCSKKVTIGAGGTALLLKNTEATGLAIETVHINLGGVASECQIHLPESEVTPTGTTVTGRCINGRKSEVAGAIAKSNETDNTQGVILFNPFIGTDRHEHFDLQGTFLAKNQSIAIDVVESVTEVSVTITGHYLV